MLNIATWTLLEAFDGGKRSHDLFEADGDERRMHVQAFRYWKARCDGDQMPKYSECADLLTTPFASRSAMIELAEDGAGRICIVGEGLDAELQPSRVATRDLFEGLLNCLPIVTLARSPVGFEADLPLIASADADFAYRGILLPLADDRQQISHVLAVMNWRMGADEDHDELAALLGLSGSPNHS